MSLISLLVEGIVRFFTMALCFGAIIAAVFTYQKELDIADLNTNLSSMIINDELLLKTMATASLAITAGVVMIPEGIAMTVVMILLYLIRNRNIYGILDTLATILDLLFILLFFCAFGAAGVLGGLSVSEWDNNYVMNPAYDQHEHTLMAMERCTVATTVLSLFSCGMCVIFAVFLVGKLANNRRSQHTGYSGL